MGPLISNVIQSNAFFAEGDLSLKYFKENIKKL
jgi:hypothetical protein